MIEHADSKGGSLCHPAFDATHLAKLLKADSYRAHALLSILADVVANGTTPVQEARSAYLRKQPAQAAHVIHNLKGCAANLGGVRVFNLACVLEPKLEARVDREDVELLLTQLEEELRTFLAEARRWMNAREAKINPRSDHSEQLLRFKEYLLDSNILACDIFESLRPVLSQTMGHEDFEALARAMDTLNFAKAVVHLSQVTE